jgi:hypothetical protein
MSDDNYNSKLIISVVNEMKTKQPKWPKSWNKKQKIEFLDDMLLWLEQEQLYEQCQIVLNAKKKIK